MRNKTALTLIAAIAISAVSAFGQSVTGLACPASTGQVGVSYSSSLLVTGGTAPFTFSILSGALPPGLILNTTTGQVIGTPTVAGSFSTTFQVVDSLGTSGTTGPAGCPITIAAPPSGCTFTSGYYKNHPEVVFSLIAENGDTLTLGTVAYTAAQIDGILAFQSVRGNGLISLAHQLIAAKLNIIGGASAPSAVITAIAQADALIGSLTIPGSGITPYGFLATSQTSVLATILDNFNSGIIGPGLCAN